MTVAESRVETGSTFDVDAVRRDFPALAQTVNGEPLAYLDSAATAQKPRQVIDAITRGYTENYANVHRGVHTLAQRATDAYEGARERVRQFLGAKASKEIVFVRGTTEAINLVAQSFLRPRLNTGDEILLTTMEHHSNIVPWQILCDQAHVNLRVVPITRAGELDLDAFREQLSERTKMIAMVHVSNALGTVNPLDAVVNEARARGIPTLFDGAQAAPHMAIDVRELGCDFYAFSGHKVCGPTGIGALYARWGLLARMEPYQGGGEMIRSVTFDLTDVAPPPALFEAGTPNIVGAIGLTAALDYVDNLGLDRIAAYEHELMDYALAKLGEIPQVRLIGTARERAAVIAFVVEGVHAHDVGTILDQHGIAVRAGHHCAQPVIDFFEVPATVRVSLAFYNTRQEIDRLVAGIDKVLEIFG